MKILLTLLVIPFALSGCAYFRQTEGVDVTAAYQITDRETVEQIDLPNLLINYAPKQIGRSDACETAVGLGDSGAKGVQNIEQSHAYFNCRIKLVPEADRQLARNALQERLLAASRQRCAAFNANLQRAFARTNFGLGILTATAGAAGALVNSVTMAHWYSGIAGVTSGARAEFNQDYMANLAAHVVTAGIEQRRQLIYQQIQKEGQSKPYAQYPVEAAIKDALYYHGECNVLTGFQVASDSIRYVTDPGLNASLQNIAKINAASQIFSGKTVDLDLLNTQMHAITSTQPILAGSSLALSSQPPDDYVRQYRSAMASIDTAIKDLKTAGIASPKAGTTLDTTRAACAKKLGTIVSAELTAITQAQTLQDVTAVSTAVSQASASHTQGEYLAKQAQSLAADYVGKTYRQIDQLNAAMTKAKAEKKTLSDDDKKKFDPAFDVTLQGVVNQLCQ